MKPISQFQTARRQAAYLTHLSNLLAAELRPANIDASAGSVDVVARIVQQVRCRWPHVRIVLRADSGFAREELMAGAKATVLPIFLGLPAILVW